MVKLRRGNRRGSSTLGCLLWLLAFAAVLYYGVHIGAVYWRYYQLVDEMRQEARVAPSLTDDIIRRRLVDQVDQLDLPPEAAHFRIKRTTRPRAITIQTEYRETIELPFFQHTFVFRPRAQEPL